MHGLEPSIDGGTVWVRAQLQGTTLCLEVQDDGRGLDASPRPGARRGNGLALNNIRERLKARYGPEAQLDVVPAPGSQRGTLSRITIPLHPAAP
jgi:sensor histidine kinase YesM